MFIIELKSKDELISLPSGKTVIICCEGCNEVYFPESEANEMIRELSTNMTVLAAIRTDYACSPEQMLLQLSKHADIINAADTLLVFSCGVGVQAVAANFKEKRVFSACNNYPLPGYQGVTPLEFDCTGCDNCHLNDTAGICPVTSCPKSLATGQCGGSRGGKCEVDLDLDCCWEIIISRIKAD